MAARLWQLQSDKFITQNIPHLPPSWEKNKSEIHTQIQTSRSANEVPGNLPILEVMEPGNNMSHLCRSVFQYGFREVFTGLASSVIHMHYTCLTKPVYWLKLHAFAESGFKRYLTENMASPVDDHVVKEGEKVVLKMGDYIQVVTVKLRR